MAQQPFLDIPGDKSATHRALLLAGMATGTSVIENPLVSLDTEATAEALRSLGVTVSPDAATNHFTVTSPGWQGWNQNPGIIDCANSGTTARLLMGILSAIPGMDVILTGDESLRQRPFKRLASLLEKMGAQMTFTSAAPGQELPLQIRGKKLLGAKITVPTASAQIKSALLFAGLFADGNTTLEVPVGSRRQTESMLAEAGVPILREYSTATEILAVASGDCSYIKPQTWTVGKDPSSLAFILAAHVGQSQSFTVTGVVGDTTRLAYLDVMRQMGLLVEVCASSDAGLVDVTFRGWPVASPSLETIVVLAQDVVGMIDEIPILSVVAATTGVQLRFCGVSELTKKESNRLLAIQRLLAAFGYQARSDAEDLCVGGLVNDLAAAVLPMAKSEIIRFDEYGDHRLAMAGAVMAMLKNKTLDLKNPACADVSFPGFFDLLGQIGYNPLSTESQLRLRSIPLAVPQSGDTSMHVGTSHV